MTHLLNGSLLAISGVMIRSVELASVDAFSLLGYTSQFCNGLLSKAFLTTTRFPLE